GTLRRCLAELEERGDKRELRLSVGEPRAPADPECTAALTRWRSRWRTVTSVVPDHSREDTGQIVQSMPWTAPPRIDAEWKRRVARVAVATEIISKLSESRLGRSVCAQFKERLKGSHDAFAASLRQLEARHSGRLEKTEATRLKVRKNYAPQLARLALESTSLKDMVTHGEERG
ncbi:PREDICTED: LOW QUALITY PROTEIN: dual serine/threonine and tyrosine protein kinase-like, partial [Priapulus caudatus]|uniref:LOW QUALITY PROTEIN: dual serine/threonine and tyrosine protein kinase-like n=1 Tax=Priapulus caudatus TaxID=37621 RepID=A0ABM1F720_PRICU